MTTPQQPEFLKEFKKSTESPELVPTKRVISLESILKPRPYETIRREFEIKARAIFAAKDAEREK
jgi:hypothetical protein